MPILLYLPASNISPNKVYHYYKFYFVLFYNLFLYMFIQTVSSSDTFCIILQFLTFRNPFSCPPSKDYRIRYKKGKGILFKKRTRVPIAVQAVQVFIMWQSDYWWAIYYNEPNMESSTFFGNVTDSHEEQCKR